MINSKNSQSLACSAFLFLFFLFLFQAAAYSEHQGMLVAFFGNSRALKLTTVLGFVSRSKPFQETQTLGMDEVGYISAGFHPVAAFAARYAPHVSHSTLLKPDSQN
jgi:hypothetical protein